MVIFSKDIHIWWGRVHLEIYKQEQTSHVAMTDVEHSSPAGFYNISVIWLKKMSPNWRQWCPEPRVVLGSAVRKSTIVDPSLSLLGECKVQTTWGPRGFLFGFSTSSQHMRDYVTKHTNHTCLKKLNRLIYCQQSNALFASTWDSLIVINIHLVKSAFSCKFWIPNRRK